MNLQPQWQRFDNATAQADALAAMIVTGLRAATAAGREASIVVPGGRSPAPLFERLAMAALPWQRVHVTLSDERWVPASDAASNESLVRRLLLQHAAVAAQFTGLRNSAAQAQSGLAGCWQSLQQLPRPFDVVVLGMGEDGHFASLFPGNENLLPALDAAQAPGAVAMQAPLEPRDRISLNLAALLDSRRILLLISGATKAAIIEQALQPGPVTALPVRALLQQQRVPVTICWSP
jgi:6-phosphogluconolactonase